MVIRVESLGKRYHRAGLRGGHGLYEAVGRLLRASFTRPAPLSLASRNRGADGDGRSWALREVSFEVGRGEILGIVGGNGAGKSTLLRVLCRVTEPTVGWASIAGRVGSLLEVGTGFHPELSGRENIYLSGAILGMRRSEIRAKFSEIVEFAEVTEALDLPVKWYSSGMYARLGFSVAAHLDHDVLIVDEVLGVSDHAFRQKCVDKLRRIVQDGRTALFVSHDEELVSRLCQRALWLERGRPRSLGPAQAVVAAYVAASEAVAATPAGPA